MSSRPLIKVEIDQEARQKLGRAFKSWVDAIEQDRAKLMGDTWIRALKNYEGKAAEKNFPWPKASNAVIPITPTDVDSFAARLHEAATSQDPVYLINTWRSGEVVPGLTWEKFARQCQALSKWMERDFKLGDLMEDVVWQFTTYGDTIVFLTWENERVADYDIDSLTGKPVKSERDVFDRPVGRCIHPKDFFIDVGETDVQLAPRAAFAFQLDAMQVRQLVDRGHYFKEEGETLLERLEPKKEVPSLEPARRGSRFETEQAQILGAGDSRPRTVSMVRCFARLDLDGDGLCEEVQFDMERDRGTILHISYNPWKHRKRELVHFYFAKRPGIFYSIGVAEMLFNIQKVMNESIRDLLNNNKIRNTKFFLARKGGPIKDNTRIYPSRLLMVDNITNDFAAVDMGSGQLATSIQDISFMQSWAERRTGITDANLGQERKSRTPASTTLALIEESNKKIDRIIDRERDSMARMWHQVFHLYIQQGDVEKLAEIAADPEDRPLFIQAITTMSHEDLARGLTIVPQVSSNNLNRGVQRTESIALFGQEGAYVQQILQLANALTTTVDPAMRKILMSAVKAYSRTHGRVLDTFDIKDQADYNPDLTEELNAAIQPAPIAPGPGSPMEQATGVLNALGPGAGPAPGRPAEGTARPSEPTSGQPG